MALMQTEPAGATEALRQLFTWAVQGLILFNVWEVTTEQHVWLTLGTSSTIGLVMWYITRSEVWAPGGQPTHPPTEKLWSEKVAATKVEGATELAALKAEYDALFSAPGHAGGDAMAPAATPVAPTPLSQDTQEGLGDSVNPGQEA